MMAPAAGTVLWQPPEAFVHNSNLHAFSQWLKRERGLEFGSYEAMWAWSVADVDAFWRAIWDFFEIISDAPPTEIVCGEMPCARWFEGTRVNYAEHVLRREHDGDPNRPVIRHSSEIRALADTSWRDLAASVRKLATSLRALGIKPGDRVVGYLPNIIETVIAMLATTATGATWSAAAPEFGTKMVSDRFGQIAPKLMFVADGYRYGGKDFDRKAEVGEIVKKVDTIETVVWLDYLGRTDPLPDLGCRIERWESLLAGPEIAPEDFHFERVAPDHPLWVLFSSGTTGLPKAIVHGHQGILVESYKNAGFHFNIKRNDCLFFYTTSGWMIWNTLMNAPLLNAVAVLYDGHPSHPDPLRIWELADEADATILGINPTLIQIMRQRNIVPAAKLGLEHLESVILAGSPVTPEAFAWVYENVKPNVWVTSQSGGTEFCSGLLGGVPGLPVRAGLIQASCLGVDARILDNQGQQVFDAPGELVLAAPLPSMPLRFWGDDSCDIYRNAYFDVWPNMWRHGDSAQINSEGGCFVFGRSDATLNRFGVRIGSAEIYHTLETINGISDSLIVCIEEADGGYYMPLFVALKDGMTLDDALSDEIRRRLRRDRSPRHVPDEIIQAPGVPMTLTGKKMEVPVRKLLMGHSADKCFSRDAMKDPSLIDWYSEFSQRRQAHKAQEA